MSEQFAATLKREMTNGKRNLTVSAAAASPDHSDVGVRSFREPILAHVDRSAAASLHVEFSSQVPRGHGLRNDAASSLPVEFH